MSRQEIQNIPRIQTPNADGKESSHRKQYEEWSFTNDELPEHNVFQY